MTAIEPLKFGGRLAASEAANQSRETGAAVLNGGWEALLCRRYRNLRLDVHAPSRSLWCAMEPTERPSYTLELMQEITDVQRRVRDHFAGTRHLTDHPFSYFVMNSNIPGIYNLGGDLRLFDQLIRSQDLAAMRNYGHVAVRAIHGNYTAFDSPVVTIALVEGDALGGGFECALSLDLIIAERSAKFGLPEILFNMFPGMGAYSFLARRLDRVRAEKLILSGTIYTGEELYELGLVDVLAEDGKGRETTLDYIARDQRRHNAHLGLLRARRRVNPVSLEELIDVVDIWAEAALKLTQFDLRKMGRLATAQDRRFAAIAPSRNS